MQGARVAAQDLVSAAELNGLSGKNVGYDKEKGRYAVQLVQRGVKMLKPVNLRLVEASQTLPRGKMHSDGSEKDDW